MPICPICSRPVAPRTHNQAFPFCSVRCRQVDLGQWLDEKYRIPATDSDEEQAGGFGKPLGDAGPSTEAAPHEAGEDPE
jgi:endogenous inhibitor of DNA gyrase (YacG/DUF329 family)